MKFFQKKFCNEKNFKKKFRDEKNLSNRNENKFSKKIKKNAPNKLSEGVPLSKEL